jgi:hypothetical protein
VVGLRIRRRKFSEYFSAEALNALIRFQMLGLPWELSDLWSVSYARLGLTATILSFQAILKDVKSTFHGTTTSLPS